jgi:hypothetical protein
MKKFFVAAALIAAAAWAGPLNANEMHQGKGGLSTGMELGRSGDSGAVLDNCAGDKANPACMGQDGKAADGGDLRLGISPRLESHFCNDRPADITVPNCNRRDLSKTPSK